MKYLSLLIPILIACGAPEAPKYFVVDSALQVGEQETVRSAVDTWCDAVGWCPEEVLWADRGRFYVVSDLSYMEGEDCERCQVVATNDGDNVKVLADRDVPDLYTLYASLLHEIGHFCERGHLDTGIMSSVIKEGQQAVIDQEAIDAWHSGCQ